MALDYPTFDRSQYDSRGHGGQYDPLTGGTAVPRDGGGLPSSTNGGYFFSDPIQKFYEGAIRSRINQVQTPLQSGLPGMSDFQNLLGQMRFQSGGPVSAAGAPSSLDSFRSFVAGFNPGVSQSFNQYIAGRDPNADVAGFQNYAAGRNPLQTVDQFRTDLGTLGPNTTVGDLRTYMQGRDPQAAAGTLQTWLQQNPGVPADYLTNVRSRINQLQGNPFSDTYMAARRTAAFGDIEQARQTEQKAVAEQLASRGIDASSGLFDRAMRQVNQRYDQQRSAAQNAITQEEFQLRQENLKQADTLEAQSAQLQMNAQQFAGQITGQIAQLQQQGVGMNDAMAQSLASLGLQDRAQQQSVMTAVAQLTQQGYQMQDALQIALTTAGLQAKQQADSLRTAGATIGLQESGQVADLQGQLAGLGTTERGQDLNLQGTVAAANAARYGSDIGALTDYFRLGQSEAQYNDQRQQSAVELAALLDQMARSGLSDFGGSLPVLR